MFLRALLALTLLAVTVTADAESDDMVNHDYRIHVFHYRKPDDQLDDKVEVYLHNKQALETDKAQNYQVHIYEDAGEAQGKADSSSSSAEDAEEAVPPSDDEKRNFFDYHSKLYHFFHEDHEDHYIYGECDIVSDKEHTDDHETVIRGRLVFKQHVNEGPLHVQIEAHGFKADHPDHGLAIHALGDIVNGCTHVGGVYNPFNVVHGVGKDKELGDFGSVHADEKGDIKLEFINKHASLYGPHSLFGRAVTIDSHPDVEYDDNLHHMGCCVIARSPGENWHEDWPHPKA